MSNLLEVNWKVGASIDFSKLHGTSLIEEMDECIRRALEEDRRRDELRKIGKNINSV